MQKAYQRINWENEPSTATPLNDDNLNKIDYSLNVIDDRVVEIFAYKETMEEKVTQAAASATAAASSASDAANSATASANSATQSAGYATNSANSAADSAASANQSAGYASDSADSASSSASSASDSANSALQSSTFADNSAASAQASATSASNSAASATESSGYATASANSANNSANSALQSADKALESSGYAEDSANSATQSAGHAEDSLDYSKLSESWAHGGTGVRQGENTNNAEYWARQAAAAIVGVATFNGRSGIIVPQLGDYDATLIQYDNEYTVGTKLEQVSNLIKVATTMTMGLVRPDGTTIFIEENTGKITAGISESDWTTIQNILS